MEQVIPENSITSDYRNNIVSPHGNKATSEVIVGKDVSSNPLNPIDKKQEGLLDEINLQDLLDAEKMVAANIGGVKAQFYPEITRQDKLKIKRDIAAEDKRFGHRDEDEKPVIRVSITNEPMSVFSTSVDERVIRAAKERQRKALGGVKLNEEPVKTIFITAQVVITKQAKEHYQEAIKLMESENYIAAITKLNKAISLRPDIIDFYVQRGECYLQICDCQSAIVNLKKACYLDPENNEYYQHLAFIYFFQGQCLFDNKQYDEALDAFIKASEMCPKENGYQTRIISCLAALQRHADCLTMIKKRLESDSASADLYILRARLHQIFRNSSLGAADVLNALALDPNHPEAQMIQEKQEARGKNVMRLAMQFSALGKFKEALQKISVAIEVDPTIAHHHVLRGALHRRLGDYNAAIDDYLIALDKTGHNEDDPSYQDAQRQLLLTYNDFAVECFTKGFYEEAVILLNKAIKGEKGETGLYINRGDCFFKQGDLHFALADYEQALEMNPDEASVKTRISVAQHEFGVLDYQDKKYIDADARFSSAIKNNPHVGRYYMSRSRTRYMLEDHEGARFDILTALVLDPSNDELISLASRLFPGRTISDVLKSPLADTARQFLQPQPAQPHRAKKVVEDHLQIKPEADTSSISPTGKTGPTSTRQSLLPDLRRCMKEWQFSLTIVEGKKSINQSIKKALRERKSLKYTGIKMSDMPPADQLLKHTKSQLIKAVKF